MNVLQLSLIDYWFRLTNNLIKKEDYRSITPYWCNRFLLYRGISKSKKWWTENYFEIEEKKCDIDEIIENLSIFCSFKKFDINTMTLGYPKKGDTSKRIKLEHKGIKIGYGNPEWGAEPNKLYFIIMHGDIIKE